MANKTNFDVNGVSYYRVTATVGKDAQGNRIRKTFYGKNRKEAERKRDAYLGLIDDGLGPNFENKKLGEVMHSWLYEVIRVSDKIKPSTFERYEGVYRNYVKPYSFAQVTLHSLTPLQVQRFYNELYEAGNTTGAITTLNSILRSFFNYCINANYIVRNPVINKAVSIPGKVSKKDRSIDVFTKDEIPVLIKGIEGHLHEMLILLALGTGLREGELLGLQWKHIDFEAGEVTVEQTLKTYVKIDKDGSRELITEIQEPKRESSNRTVPLPDNLIEKLKLHKNKAKNKAAAWGIEFSENDFVFTNAYYSYVDARAMVRSYKRLLKRIGLRQRDFHSLRHTFATTLISKNANIEIVSRLLGHSSTETTQIYIHPQKEDKKNAVKLLNDIF